MVYKGLVTSVPWHEGDVIRKLRAAFRWTLEDLATRSGLDLQTIHRIEIGTTRNPTRDTLDKIAAAFNLSRRELEDAVPRAHAGVPVRRRQEESRARHDLDEALRKSLQDLEDRRQPRREERHKKTRRGA